MDVGLMETADPGLVPPDAETPKMPDETEVLEEFNSRFRHSRSHYADWREETRTLYDLIAGRQWDSDDEASLKEQGRPAVVFNLSSKYMDAISGLQVNNRQDIKFLPRELGDAQANELLTSAVSWGRDLTDTCDDETDAFYDSVLTGYGWVQGYLDRDVLADGVPAGQRIDPLEMFPDPAARKRNLTDGRYCIRVKFVDSDEYSEIVGKTTGEDDSNIAELVSEEDDVLTVIEEPQDYKSPSQADSSKRARKPVAEYEFWRREKQMVVQAKDFGQTTMELHEWKIYEGLLKAAKAQYKAIPVQKKVFYRALIAAGSMAELKRSPYQEGFTFHSITGKRDRNKGTFYGLGRSIVDPQRWVNKFFSTILYSLMTNAKGGLLAEEDAFTDARKAEAEWANPAAITWLRKGALSQGKVQDKAQAKYPEGMDRLMQFSMNAIPQVSGMNAELLGLAERVQAGVVEAQRKQSAMAVLAWAFDAMRRYYRSMGRQMGAYVRDYMSEGTLILIHGESGRQYVPLVKKHLAMVYDVVVDEAPTSVNQKERTWAVLETLIPQMLQAGMKMPKEILDYSPLPTDLAEKWKKALEPDPQSQQLQAGTMKATLDKLIAEVQKLQAGAQLDTAKAQEIMAELGKPGEQPGQQAQIELLKAQVDAQVQSKIAEFKANRDAETKLMMKQMDIDSAERIAAMQAQIETTLERNRMENDSKLEQSRQQHDSNTKLTVAALAKGRTTDEQEQAESGEETAMSLVAEAVSELKEAISKMNDKPEPKARKFKVKRDKNGDLAEIEEG